MSAVAAPPVDKTTTAAIPWHLWCAALAVTSAMIGVHWDISWHRSIGRDTFWTPAHIAIYLCGVLAGISCGYLILSTTFGRNGATGGAAVKIWGFRGPLGAFICAWGGIAMLTSAPFDDWWHNTYGLDVKILSPPHIVLALGIVSIELGALILILGAMNRASGDLRGKLEWFFLYVAGMVLVALLVVFAEHIHRVALHTARMYRTVSLLVPLVLAGVALASRKRWSSTMVVAVYTAFLLGLEWILPLFPAEPKLGPVYVPVKQFVPPGFPLLILAPALALDLLRPKLESRRRWLQAAVAGAVFLGVLVLVEWPFANFLMTPGARNWVFGSHWLDYATHPNSYSARHQFVPLEKTAMEFWIGMGGALAAAILSTRLGLAWGGWMQRLRR